MRDILPALLLSIAALSCAGQTEADETRFPIIRYDPTTYLSDIESAFADPASCGYLSADSLRLSGIDEEIIAYLSDQDTFILQLSDDDAQHAPKFIGIRDKERGYLKYLDVEKELHRYSLDQVIEDLYGSLEDYIATWPEDQRHLFHDDPQGLYTFPHEQYAVSVIGYSNSANLKNPVKFKAAISFMRTSRQEWNDDTWANDSTEIVRHSKSVAGAFLYFPNVGRAMFENNDANYFSKWVNERLTYPDEALESAATGRVTLHFTIDMFGNLESLKILRGRHPALDSIAFNVVSSSPEWTPAEDFLGNPWSVTYTLPVIFTPEMMYKSFITKMYDEKLYEDSDFLQKHCSPELLKKLQDAYPYDSDEPAYATWLFRSGQQDSKPGSDGRTAMLEVTSDGNWYTYKALDMGWEFTNSIRIGVKDGKIVIDDIDLRQR